MNFVSDTSKTTYTNIVTRKCIIMIRNKYIYDFWKTIFYFALSAVQLHVGILTMIICQKTFVTWEEQRNNFTLDKEKEKYD